MLRSFTVLFTPYLVPALLCACSASSAPPAVPSDTPLAPPVAPAESAAADAPHRAAPPRPGPPFLRKAKVRLDDRPVAPSPPVVDAVVGGQPVQLIVDTGASGHVIAAWVARRIGASLVKLKGSGTAHGGEAVALSRLDGVNLTLSGFGKVDVPSLFVTEVPDELRRHGMGGVISPQALVTGGHGVVLDLVQGELTEWEQGVVEEMIRPGAGPMVEVQRCAGGGAGALLVRARVEGQEVGLQLDTGSSTSSISRTTALGKRLSKLATSRTKQLTASGAHTVPAVPDARIEVGPHASKVRLDLSARPPGICGDGYMGMDVLRRCVLFLAGSDARLSCQSP